MILKIKNMFTEVKLRSDFLRIKDIFSRVQLRSDF